LTLQQEQNKLFTGREALREESAEARQQRATIQRLIQTAVTSGDTESLSGLIPSSGLPGEVLPSLQLLTQNLGVTQDRERDLDRREFFEGDPLSRIPETAEGIRAVYPEATEPQIQSLLTLRKTADKRDKEEFNQKSILGGRTGNNPRTVDRRDLEKLYNDRVKLLSGQLLDLQRASKNELPGTTDPEREALRQSIMNEYHNLISPNGKENYIQSILGLPTTFNSGGSRGIIPGFSPREEQDIQRALAFAQARGGVSDQLLPIFEVELLTRYPKERVQALLEEIKKRGTSF